MRFRQSDFDDSAADSSSGRREAKKASVLKLESSENGDSNPFAVGRPSSNDYVSLSSSFNDHNKHSRAAQTDSKHSAGNTKNSNSRHQNKYGNQYSSSSSTIGVGGSGKRSASYDKALIYKNKYGCDYAYNVFTDGPASSGSTAAGGMKNGAINHRNNHAAVGSSSSGRQRFGLQSTFASTSSSGSSQQLTTSINKGFFNRK